MAAFKRFEEIDAWKDARDLAFTIYAITDRPEFQSDPKLRWQMRGSSGSVMDNIAEGFSRGGTNEFMQFMRIARGSAGELQSQLYRAYDRGWITEKEFDAYYNDCHTISRKCYNLIQHLKNSDNKGPTYQKPQ